MQIIAGLLQGQPSQDEWLGNFKQRNSFADKRSGLLMNGKRIRVWFGRNNGSKLHPLYASRMTCLRYNSRYSDRHRKAGNNG